MSGEIPGLRRISREEWAAYRERMSKHRCLMCEAGVPVKRKMFVPLGLDRVAVVECGRNRKKGLRPE